MLKIQSVGKEQVFSFDYKPKITLLKPEKVSKTSKQKIVYVPKRDENKTF